MMYFYSSGVTSIVRADRSPEKCGAKFGGSTYGMVTSSKSMGYVSWWSHTLPLVALTNTRSSKALVSFGKSRNPPDRI